MRGTFSAREMVAKARTPSTPKNVSISLFSFSLNQLNGLAPCSQGDCQKQERIEDRKLTDSSNNLRLHAKLILESSREIRDLPLLVRRHVRHRPDVVVHVSRREEQHQDQADGGPEVAILDEGQDVRIGDGAEGHGAQGGGCADGDEDVVDGADEAGVWAVCEVAG